MTFDYFFPHQLHLHQRGTRGTEIPFPLHSRAFARRVRGGPIPRARGARRASSARRWLFPETRAAADRSRLFFRAARNTRQICSPSAIARAEIAPRPKPTGSAVPCVMTRPFARPESRSSRRTRRVSYPSRRPISNSPDGRRADLSIIPFLSRFATTATEAEHLSIVICGHVDSSRPPPVASSSSSEASPSARSRSSALRPMPSASPLLPRVLHGPPKGGARAW